MSSSESEEVGIKNGDLFVKQKAEQTKKAKSKKDKKVTLFLSSFDPITCFPTKRFFIIGIHEFIQHN